MTTPDQQLADDLREMAYPGKIPDAPWPGPFRLAVVVVLTDDQLAAVQRAEWATPGLLEAALRRGMDALELESCGSYLTDLRLDRQALGGSYAPSAWHASSRPFHSPRRPSEIAMEAVDRQRRAEVAEAERQIDALADG